MKVWIYEKDGWPCLVYEDELDRWRQQKPVATFESLWDALPLTAEMCARAAAQTVGETDTPAVESGGHAGVRR